MSTGLHGPVRHRTASRREEPPMLGELHPHAKPPSRKELQGNRGGRSRFAPSLIFRPADHTDLIFHDLTPGSAPFDPRRFRASTAATSHFAPPPTLSPFVSQPHGHAVQRAAGPPERRVNLDYVPARWVWDSWLLSPVGELGFLTCVVVQYPSIREIAIQFFEVSPSCGKKS